MSKRVFYIFLFCICHYVIANIHFKETFIIESEETIYDLPNKIDYLEYTFNSTEKFTVYFLTNVDYEFRKASKNYYLSNLQENCIDVISCSGKFKILNKDYVAIISNANINSTEAIVINFNGESRTVTYYDIKVMLYITVIICASFLIYIAAALIYFQFKALLRRNSVESTFV